MTRPVERSGANAFIVQNDPLTQHDEFSHLEDFARRASLEWHDEAVVRRQSIASGHGKISMLRWGKETPDEIYLHGRGQNAHTWDTVIMAGGHSALAIDLPGHGRSDWRTDHNHGAEENARTLSGVLTKLAPGPFGIVGMSLGGLTTMFLASRFKSLVKWIVIVDITPAARLRKKQRGKSQMADLLVGGQRDFARFDEMIDAAHRLQPERSRASLESSVRNNARIRSDGTWGWAYDQDRSPGEDGDHSLDQLWEDIELISVPMTLVRAEKSPYTHDEDAEAIVRHVPHAEVVTVLGASHAIQSGRPIALSEIIADVRRRAT